MQSWINVLSQSRFLQSISVSPQLLTTSIPAQLVSTLSLVLAIRVFPHTVPSHHHTLTNYAADGATRAPIARTAKSTGSRPAGAVLAGSFGILECIASRAGE